MLKVFLFVGGVLSVVAVPTAQAAEPVRSKPKLIVLVYFDQMRGDYLSRWQANYGKDGFRRMMTDGAWFSNCHYPYSYTVTGAGHASVATGCPPQGHGIVGNDWYDRSAGKSVNCVGTDRYKLVDSPPEGTGKKSTKAGSGPDRLMQPSIGDALRKAVGSQAKIVGLSMKNRGAILPTGHAGDAVYWMDSGSGRFVTSTYYRDTPHTWVTEYNATKPAERWRGKQWERLRSDLDYAKLSGPDDVSEEGSGAGQGRTFPHPFEPTGKKGKSRFFDAIYTSPFGNELLLELAEKAIDAEKLGSDEVTDLLTVSFSSNDAVGHAWGPDSQEVLDVTLRADTVMDRLLKTLDAKVGKGAYVLAMTADHGVCPLPGVSRTQGREAERVQPFNGTTVEEFLTERFKKGKAKWVEAIAGPWIYLDEKAISNHGAKRDEVAKVLGDWLKAREGVADIYTRSQLLATGESKDPFLPMVRKSFYPSRCGDVYVLLKPYYLSSSKVGTGTTHGTPYEYDTHVPLVVFGGAVKPGEHRERVTPLAASAILAEAAGIPAPSGSTAPAPAGLFTK